MSIRFLEPHTTKHVRSATKRTLQNLWHDSEILKKLRKTLRMLSKDIRFITCIEREPPRAPVSWKGIKESECNKNS